jgi:hypothetical protein
VGSKRSICPNPTCIRNSLNIAALPLKLHNLLASDGSKVQEAPEQLAGRKKKDLRRIGGTGSGSRVHPGDPELPN